MQQSYFYLLAPFLVFLFNINVNYVLFYAILNMQTFSPIFGLKTFHSGAQSHLSQNIKMFREKQRHVIFMESHQRGKQGEDRMLDVRTLPRPWPMVRLSPGPIYRVHPMTTTSLLSWYSSLIKTTVDENSYVTYCLKTIHSTQKRCKSDQTDYK